MEAPTREDRLQELLQFLDEGGTRIKQDTQRRKREGSCFLCMESIPVGEIDVRLQYVTIEARPRHYALHSACWDEVHLKEISSDR